jgi:hypothetical protein
MSEPVRDDLDDAGGHYVTAGTTLVGLGAVAIAAAAVLAMVLRVDLRFIDGQTMAVIGGGFVGVGGWMIAYGRRSPVAASDRR